MSQSPDPEAPPPAPVEPPPPVEAPPSSPVVSDSSPAAPDFMMPAPSAVAPKRRRRWWRPEMRARELAIFLRGALLLTVTGFSLAAFALQLTGTFRARSLWNLHDFVNHNELAKKVRLQMLLWLGAGGAAGALGALVLYVRRSRRAVGTGRAGRVFRVGRLLSPLMLPSLAWSLVVATGWDPLSRVSGIVVVALLTRFCVRGAVGEVLGGRLALARLLARAGASLEQAFARARRRVPLEAVTVLVAAGFYALFMSWATILQHRHFGTAALDLGNLDTMFFNALHGHPFRCPSVFPQGPSGSMLSVHVELTMFALLPFYALHPGAETLLVLQAFAVASGAIPLYRLATRRLTGPAALVLALAYLLYAPLHEANFYDVHLAVFAVAFTLWALDLLEARRPLLFALFFALALGCREDVALGFAIFGTYLLLRGKYTRATLVMTVVAVAYFAVVELVVMPHFEGPWSSALYRDPTGAGTYGGAFRTLLANPLFAWKTFATLPKLALFLLVLAPVVLLPLRRELLWLGLAPALPFLWLSSGYGPNLQLGFQDAMLYVPFLFYATALALAAERGASGGRARLAGALCGIVMATFLTTRVWGAMPPGDQCSGGFRDIPLLRPVTVLEKQKARDLAELAAKIPKDASVAVSETEHPHVSTRLDCLALRNGYEGAAYILSSDDGAEGAAAGRALASGAYEVIERRPTSRLSLLKAKQK